MDFKNFLRKKILIERKYFDISKYRTENESIVENVNIVVDSLYKNLKSHNVSLGLYSPLKSEPDLSEIILNNNYSIALPKINNDYIMKFAHYQKGDKLEMNKHGINQPIRNNILTPNIIIVPGLAYSIKGYRLGFGTGYYDRYLGANNLTIKIGVCFDEFLLEYIPAEKHDVKFDYIITDKMVLEL